MSESVVNFSRVRSVRSLKSLLYLRGVSANAEVAGEVALLPNGDLLVRFASPSEAILEGLRVLAASVRAKGSVITTEADDSVALETAAAACEQAEPDQLLACLATREASRVHLGGEIRFLDVGQMLGRGDHFLRLFLLEETARAAAPEVTAFPETSRFIGRRSELAELHRYLDRSRTVILRGGAGIGKSALLRQYLSEYEHLYKDGSMLVDLSKVDDANLVIPTVVRALEVPREGYERGVHAVVSFLSDRQMLVAFDGAERWTHVVAPLVAQLTDASLDGAFVVATQKRIRIPRALVLPLSGLERPPETVDPYLLSQYDASALFIERAQQVEPSFEPDVRNARWIAKLCERLEGNPLAIELAATKIATLTPRQIHDRLDESLALLKSPTASLVKTIGMAVELAGDSARNLLRRMAVLRGAHTATTLAALCADDSFTATSVLHGFEELVDASLLTASQVRGDEQFYYLPETIRLFALQQVGDVQEVRRMESRRDAWALDLSRDYLANVNSHDQLLWQDRLDAAYVDLRQTLDRLIKAGRGQEAVLVARACQRLWFERAYFAEGIAFFDRIEKMPSLRRTPERLRIANLRAVFHSADGRGDEGRKIAVGVLRRARKSRFTEIEYLVLTNLGFIYQATNRRFKCRSYYRKGVLAAMKNGDEDRAVWGIANYIGLGAGPISEDESRFLQIARSYLERHPNPTCEQVVETNWAERLMANGRYLEARSAGIRAMKLAVQLDHPQAIRQTAHGLGKTMFGLDQPDVAVVVAGFCRRLISEIADPGRPPEDPLEDAVREAARQFGDSWVNEKLTLGSMMSPHEALNLVISTV